MYRQKSANQELSPWRGTRRLPSGGPLIGSWGAVLAITLGFLLLSPAHCQPANKQQLEQQLEAVKEKLQRIEQELATSASEFARETAALREVETAISRTRRDINTLSDSIAGESAALAALDQQSAALTDDLKTQTRQLAAAVRHAWSSGQGSGLRALLSIDDLSGASRQLQYQRLIAQARAQQLALLKNQLAELIQVRSEAATRRQSLKTQRQQQSARQASLLQQQRQRAAATATLKSAIADKQRQSQELKADSERLNQLIAELAELFADIPARLDGNTGLPSPAKNLRLPVEGRVIKGAGSPKPGGMHRLGLLISAQPGAPVAAMSYGRVAYADWLRGFGLLIIVDHGDGYLSLYAFNESLYREVGDWVGAGDVIAGAGASGGQSSPALYFELRRNGQPVDPRPWLK